MICKFCQEEVKNGFQCDNCDVRYITPGIRCSMLRDARAFGLPNEERSAATDAQIAGEIIDAAIDWWPWWRWEHGGVDPNDPVSLLDVLHFFDRLSPRAYTRLTYPYVPTNIAETLLLAYVEQGHRKLALEGEEQAHRQKWLAKQEGEQKREVPCRVQILVIRSEELQELHEFHCDYATLTEEHRRNADGTSDGAVRWALKAWKGCESYEEFDKKSGPGIYQHDCDGCEFIETTKIEGERYDIYRCSGPLGADVTWLARYGDRADQYWSMPWHSLEQMGPPDHAKATPLTQWVYEIAKREEDKRLNDQYNKEIGVHGKG